MTIKYYDVTSDEARVLPPHLSPNSEGPRQSCMHQKRYRCVFILENKERKKPKKLYPRSQYNQNQKKERGGRETGGGEGNEERELDTNTMFVRRGDSPWSGTGCRPLLFPPSDNFMVAPCAPQRPNAKKLSTPETPNSKQLLLLLLLRLLFLVLLFRQPVRSEAFLRSDPRLLVPGERVNPRARRGIGARQAPEQVELLCCCYCCCHGWLLLLLSRHLCRARS